MSEKRPSPDQGKPRWTALSIALFVHRPSHSCSCRWLHSVGWSTALSSGFARGDWLTSMILILGLDLMALGAFLVYAGLKSRRRD